MNLINLTKKEAEEQLQAERVKYAEFGEMKLKLDMSRGKPSSKQLDLSMGLLDALNSASNLVGSSDYRNYGILDGIPEIKKIFCELCNLDSSEIIVAGNASLNLMYDSVQRAMQFGVDGNTPFNHQNKIKWLCPVPGYDRHFAITELFNIEMINIPMTENGPDVDMIEKLVASDSTIKGIWCVPKYSNPQGIVYSDDVVKRLANLKPLAKDFRIYWDNAYMIHSIEKEGDNLLDILAECKKAQNSDLVYIFGSTSKVTFAGAGIAFVAGSAKNMTEIKKYMTIQTIGPDKVNQLAHALFFKNAQGLIEHMSKHEALMKPKFDKVNEILNKEMSDSGIITWIKPRGGYFISCDLYQGTARRTIELAKNNGVIFTSAGSTYPLRLDPNNSNLRIAPSLPPINELELAMLVFANSAKIAYLESKVSL